MTDKERLCKVFDRLSIGYKDSGCIILLEEGMSKVKGYNGFYTMFEFDIDGKFKEVGIYEK